MRTSEEIYHRVRWDPRFDPSRFVFGVEQRAAAVKRVPLPGFVPGGEIPWHRILFVEAEGELVWERATGLDRIDESGLGRAEVPRFLRAPHFIAGTPHAWDPVARAWQPFAVQSPRRRTTRSTRSRDHALRVLTWNSLWDKYDSDRLQTLRRRPLLLTALERADADVIALQEVEPDLLAMVLATAWVRADYTMNTDPRGKEVDRGGLLLLSRLPMREAGSIVLGPRKALAAVTVDTESGPLVIAATHLSSDHSDNGAGRRREQLATIAEALASVDGNLVLVGDFNDGSEASDDGCGPAAALDLLDVWTAVHGSDDHTPTFDPIHNPLAAISSLSGRASRLDRVLLRREGPRPTAAVVYGDKPAADGLFVSDHFGVLADLEFAAAGTSPDPDTADGAPNLLDVPPTARTALAWIPPKDLWPTIQNIRGEYDPQFHRWPPHVNILFGFVPESAFERAAPLLEAALAEIAPFPTRLDGVQTFGHRDDATLWLDPAAETGKQWTDLRHALERRFPRCRGRAEGFTPHLTLGRTRNPQRATAQVAARLPAMPAEVGELVLLSRRGEEPMSPRAIVTLGTGRLRWLPEADDAFPLATEPGAESPQHTALATRTTARLAQILPNAVVHTVGSRRMGCALPEADLDLVAALSGAADVSDVSDLASLVRSHLPNVTRLRHVVGARVPGLKFSVEGLAVDLGIVATGQIPPDEAVTRRAALGEAAATTLSAVRDADAIRAAVRCTARDEPDDSGQAAFAHLARGVKAWAKARGLDSAPFGGLPGVAWSILAARTVMGATAASTDPTLHQFFATWAAWDWRESVHIGIGPTADAAAAQAPVTIMTPAYPVRNCAVQVSAAGRDLLVAELYRAWEITEASARSGSITWPDLLGPAPLHRRHAAWAVLSVRADQSSVFDRLHGRVRGRMLALLAALDEAGIPDTHAWPRPFETGPTNARYAIGLGPTPPDKGTLAAVASRWTTGLPGVTIDLAECGAVPTLR